MAAQQSSALRTLLVLGFATSLSGCDHFFGLCGDAMYHTLFVEVRDSASNGPAAIGATGVSEHESGEITELIAGSDLELFGKWGRELPGEHTISVWKPGYLPYVVDAHVDADRCHVETETVEADIALDPRAVPEHPISFIQEPDTASGWRSASAEVQVYGDTLEIKGLSGTRDCVDLQVVPFRSGARLHVQVQASDVPQDECVGWRRFEARFLLPSGATHLLVTNPAFFPVVLFNGEVRPAW